MERRRARLAQLLRFAVAGSLTVSAPALAANWKYIATDIDGSLVYIDLDSIKVEGDGHVGTFWEKWDYSHNVREKNHILMQQWRANCAANTLTLLAYTSYDVHNRITASLTIPPYGRDVSAVVPESVGENILQAVCHS